jgi:hypothetical protein
MGLACGLSSLQSQFHFFSRALAIVKTAHSVPVHHSHFSCWQSRGTPLPATLLPGTPVANANGHILGKFITSNSSDLSKKGHEKYCARYSGSLSAICLISLRYCLKALRPFFVSASAVCGFLSMNSFVTSTYPASSSFLR